VHAILLLCECIQYVREVDSGWVGKNFTPKLIMTFQETPMTPNRHAKLTKATGEEGTRHDQHTAQAKILRFLSQA